MKTKNNVSLWKHFLIVTSPMRKKAILAFYAFITFSVTVRLWVYFQKRDTDTPIYFIVKKPTSSSMNSFIILKAT